MKEQWPYLPTWATFDEATAWLEEVTGERWPLPRFLEWGLWPAVWLAPDPAGHHADVMSGIFGNRAEGFLAPVCFAGDIHRLAVDRTGCLTMTRNETGELIRFAPGIDFTVSGLRFAADSLKGHATRFGGKPAAAVVKLKKDAFIEQYLRVWKSIDRDLSEASRNDLKVAKLGGGYWDVSKALAWAKSKGKLTDSGPAVRLPWHPG